jgi:ribose/xylose/arabinose/galactoside ABC-type transport system permease subunit
MTALIVAVGAYATVRQDAFLTSFNLNNLLLMAMPLALVSLGQTCALLVGGFDVSVAALMTFCVVLASYTMSFDTSGWALFPGGLALIAAGLATGIFNAVIIRVLKLPSIIATLGRSASWGRRSSFAITPKDIASVPSLCEPSLRPDCLHRRRGPPSSAMSGCIGRARASP